MDIFSVITLLGGLAFFLYGMNAMSGGLEKIAGGKLEAFLLRMTSTPIKGLLLGIVVTATIQSSSAVTVMLVGLVNSGIMQLSQSVGVIMGSNIGTTITAWLLSLVGIEGSNFFLRLLKPENFSLIFALIGIILIMFSKKSRRKDVGGVLIAFAVLMFGMKMMSSAVAPLADSPAFADILTYFKNPILALLVGAAFTAIIQSSSASVGILQALALTGCIDFGIAFPIILGQNIGTCVTALISSVGTSTNAKRVAVIHVIFNVIGAVIALALFTASNAIWRFAFVAQPIGVLGIAVTHTIFNVFNTLLIFPFTKYFVRLVEKLGVDKAKTDEELAFLDSRLLAMPSVAAAECNKLAVSMSRTAKTAVVSSLALLSSFNERDKERVMELEDVLDNYEDKLGTYLVKLAHKDLSDEDSKTAAKILHSIGDFERLGDHAVNLTHSAQEIKDKGIAFSPSASKELRVIGAAVKEIVELTISAYEQNDYELSRKVEPLEQVIDDLAVKIKSNHINRLQEGSCTIQMGFILSDLLTNFKRISDHCSNIAVALIESEKDSFLTHNYLNTVKTAGNGEFVSQFDEYKQKYDLNNV